MEMQKFNPHNPEYKKVEDLPKEEQVNFKDVDGGFVKKTALEDIDEVRAEEEYLMEIPEGFKIREEQIKNCEQLVGHDEAHDIRDEVRWLGELMEEPLRVILSEIERGDFQLLIGDDASGRIPTLIVKKFINEVNSRNARTDIATKFIAGTSMHDYPDMGATERLKEEKISAYIEKLKEVQPYISSTLIITEFIESGQGLVPLTKALKKNNIMSTIISPVVDMKFRRSEEGVSDIKERIEEYLGSRILYGISNTKPSIYSKSDISGVKKNILDLHATPVRSKMNEDEKEITLAKMTIARDEANLAADRLIAELLD